MKGHERKKDDRVVEVRKERKEGVEMRSIENRRGKNSRK